MPNQSLVVNDFTGGITDNYTGGANTSMFKEADNFFVADDKYLYTRPALTLNDRAFPRIPTQSAIGRQFVIDGVVVSLSDIGVYYKDTTGFHEVLGPTGNRAFDLSDAKAKFCAAKHHNQFYLTNDHFPTIVTLTKDVNNWKVRTLGVLKPVTSGITFSGTGIGPKYYIIRQKVTYTVNGITYEELSPYSDILTSQHDLPTTISGIGVVVNSTSSNYDTDNITIQIYRTTAVGNIFYRVGEVTNGTTSFVDNVSDLQLVLAADLIDVTNLASDVTPTPKAKYIHQVNDILWLIQPITSGAVEKSKLRQCVRFQPYNSPGDFEEDFDAELTGISSVNIYPLVFTATSVYRIEGYYQINGAGGITKRRISDTVGCVNQDSIVQTNDGVFFASNTGFYFTDGYKVSRLSASFNKSFRNYVQSVAQMKNIFGCHDQLTNKVMWTVQTDINNTYADKIFVCHLKWGYKEEMPFTTWSGGKVDGQNFRPTSLFFYKDKIYVGEDRGYFLNFDYNLYSDDKIDTTTTPDNWITNTILYRYVSMSFDFGFPTLRKWVTWLILNMDNVSSVSLRASLANDNSAVFSELAEVKYKSNIAWGDPDLAWGDDTIKWDYNPTLATKRRVPTSNRCSYKQLMLENSYSHVDSSLRIGKCIVDATAQTATLVGVIPWQENCIDYYLELTVGIITTEYKIQSRTDTVLTLENTSGLLLSGTYDWQIRGYRRDEIMKLIEFSLVYTPVSMSQEPHTGPAE